MTHPGTTTGTTTKKITRLAPKRQALLAAARRRLWGFLQARTRPLAPARSTLRRRLGDFLRRSAAGRLAAILRSGALAGAVAAALAAPGGTRGQEVEFGPIELANVARGEGGFVARGEAGWPRSGAGQNGSEAGDVNGDGIPDLIVAGWWRDNYFGSGSAPTYVVFCKRGGEAFKLSDVQAGRGGFSIRWVEKEDGLNSSVSGAGDVNGDGLADVLVGALGADSGGRPNAGESYVVFGKPDCEPVDLAEVQAGRGGFAIRGVAAGDYSGSSVSAAGDVNGDGLADLIVGAPGADSEGRANAGECYVVFGKPGSEAVELADVQAGQGGFAIRGSVEYDRSGQSVSGAGDVNGDGLADLLVGAPYADSGGRENAGESYVIFGKPGSEAVELADVQAGQGGFAIRGSVEYDRSGRSVSGAGDVDGDGLADLLVGAPYADPGGRLYAGESYVVFGKPGGEAVELAEVKAGRGGFAIRGAEYFDNAGWSVSRAGDVNGDDLADLLIGAPHADQDGRAYVVFGKPGGEEVEFTDIQAGRGGFAIGEVPGGGSPGESVSGAGDLNGDGLADLLVGAPRAHPGGGAGYGESYVVFGKPGGEAVKLSEVRAGRGGFAFHGVAADDRSNLSVSGAGDVNGDGLADIIVGASEASPGSRVLAGESYVVFGKPGGGAIEIVEGPAGQGGFAIRAVAEGDRLGSSVAGAGDVNGDGLADLIVGAPGADPGGRAYAGESYVVFGKPGGEAVELADVQAGRGGFAIHGGAEGDSSGRSVSGAGDVNGDGLADLFIGAPGANPGGRVDSGESYVVFGKPDGEAVELADIQAGRGGFAIHGVAESDSSGRSVAGAGDVNGDGLADLIVGAPEADPGSRASAGESYVVFGKPGGEAVELAEVQTGRGGFAIRGVAEGDYSGWSVSGARDVNGDGLADVLVGAPGADPGDRVDTGESYVVFGKPGGEAVELAEVQAGRGGFAIRGVAEGDTSGASVSGAGDTNGDGLADIILGSGRDAGGEDYVVFGKSSGEAVRLADVQAGRGGIAIRGVGTSDRWGSRVAGAGDVDGDGLADDLVIASGLPDARYPSISGAAYVVFGPKAPPPRRFRRGAGRGEEVLDISDGIRVLGYLFLGSDEPPCLDAADADDSGTLDITDGIRVLGYLLLGGDEPPDPGPTTCGEDPTPDNLGCATPSRGCAP